MLVPPVSDLTPWMPDHWITESGYALNSDDVAVGNRNDPGHGAKMLKAVIGTQEAIESICAIKAGKMDCIAWAPGVWIAADGRCMSLTQLLPEGVNKGVVTKFQTNLTTTQQIIERIMQP
jgi:hypothetical protein